MPGGSYIVKDWKDAPSPSTPIDAEALEDLEVRTTNYADGIVAVAVGTIEGTTTEIKTQIEALESNSPDEDQKEALVGTSGAPSGINAYVTNSDPRLSDARTPTNGSVTAGKIAAALKPSEGAAAGTESLRALGTTGSTAAAGNDGRFPSEKEKAALVGTSGTPEEKNPFVTKKDREAIEARLTRIDLEKDWSSGEIVSAQLSHNVDGVRANLKHGTAADPVTVAQPTFKVSRVEKASREAIGAITGNKASDGAAGLCAAHFSAKGVVGSEGQAVGVFGGAINESSYEGEDGPDAVGLYGIGRITGGTSTLASCYGLVAYGRRDVATAVINGAEIGAMNYTATSEAYNPNGSGKARGIWLVAGGEADSSVGVAINNPFGRQFEVGIGFGNTETSGKKGGIKAASIRDDSTSERSLLIKGTHSKAAIAVAAAAGPVIIGGEEGAFATAGLEVIGGEENRDPLATFRVVGNKSARVQLAANSPGNVSAMVAGAVNAFFVGTAIGDSGFTFTAGKAFWIGANGKTAMLRATETGLGFFGKAPAARPNVKAPAEVTSKELCEALETLGLIE